MSKLSDLYHLLGFSDKLPWYGTVLKYILYWYFQVGMYARIAYDFIIAKIMRKNK